MPHHTKRKDAKTRRLLDALLPIGERRNGFRLTLVLLRFEVDYYSTSDYIGQTLRDRDRVSCMLLVEISKMGAAG